MDMTGDAVCTCGRPMEGHGGSFGPEYATTMRQCDCGIKALFFSIDDEHEMVFRVVRKDAEETAKEEKERLLSVFATAEIRVVDHWDIRNEYHGNAADWLLVDTELGMIRIGWRKRVISINWRKTGIRMVVDDDVTKDEYGCHAWSYVDAARYLKRLKEGK